MMMVVVVVVICGVDFKWAIFGLCHYCIPCAKCLFPAKELRKAISSFVITVCKHGHTDTSRTDLCQISTHSDFHKKRTKVTANGHKHLRIVLKTMYPIVMCPEIVCEVWSQAEEFDRRKITSTINISSFLRYRL
jgi:hypothetical protein